MKRIFRAYKELLIILFSKSPFLVIVIFLSAIITGAIMPVSVWVNSKILNLGLEVASGSIGFSAYTPYLALFVVITILPAIIGDLFNAAYIRPRVELILRTALKGEMLKKLSKLRYEHLENEESLKIIDSVYRRDDGAEEVASDMARIYLRGFITSMIASVGTLYIVGSVKWWLILTILIPVVIDAYISLKYSKDIYKEMASFWDKDRQYGVLGNMLKSRKFIIENTLIQASGFLVNTYRNRLSKRNREYEKYFFKHMRRKLAGKIIISISQIVNALLLLILYLNGELSIGVLVSLTLIMFTGFFDSLKGIMNIFLVSGRKVVVFEFYDKYFQLSESEYGEDDEIPTEFSIEFNNVHFTYPGTDRKVLNGLSMKIEDGAKVSIVGENGEGKTTMIKLLLGLFQPDSGEILIGGKPLGSYSRSVQRKMFGPIFQDFMRYSMTIGENIGIGDIDKIDDRAAISSAMQKAGVDSYIEAYINGIDTLLGRDFEGGVDLSGGQWQRIAIARAFMGDKPILILDEPTNQLDPMAESRIYSEFAEISENKTSIFVTHRLGSTVITDKIFVIAKGKIAQSGSHDELMASGGLYADMFSSQKQWYVQNEEVLEYVQ